MMKNKKHPLMIWYVLSSHILVSMQDPFPQRLPLLVSQKSNTAQSILILQKSANVKKKIHTHQPFCLPQEIQKIIVKLRLFACWQDEITYLKGVSPIKIGNAELEAIDLWRLSVTDRDQVLCFDGKKTFAPHECDALKKIIPEQDQQNVVIHRLPVNEELYQDWVGISGGRCYARFIISPALGAGLCAGAVFFGHTVGGFELYNCLSVGVGLAATATIIGSSIAYHCHNRFLDNNIVAMNLADA